ncbi:hypothetical protein [Microbacterium excoecariae]|uniref:hypothetical protein n=1 Tax=Microbacterium excoecariae TaxID=2715210 RepID=UPI00140C4C19|nr:hypothetical protein [Microbacterium excoecariae]NHI17081.1 hypothetical protein [Microbacterium excoecariae]
MDPSAPRVISVRRGHVQPTRSSLYVLIDVDTRAIAYIGGAGFDPELRAYLHVESEDPRLARVRATVPRYDERDFDVLAFELPAGADRSAAKQALIQRLAESGAHAGEAAAEDGLRDVTDPIVQGIARYGGGALQDSASP